MSTATLQRRFQIAATLAIAVAAPLLVHWRARVQAREWSKLLREQAARLVTLSKKNQRLSNLVAAAVCSLSAQDFNELLRLRGEMLALREKANEAAHLRAAGDRSSDARTNSVREFLSTMPEAQTIQAYWPKEQLSSSGYATPLTALQTTLWAFTQNNPEILAASLDPQTRSNLIASAFSDGGPEERLAWHATAASESILPASGFYVGQEISSAIPGLNPELHVIPVYFEKEGATRLFCLRKFNEEWKLQTINGLTGTAQDITFSPPDFQFGTQLWP